MAARLTGRWTQGVRLGLFLLVALVTRCAVFGDWNYQVDDQFYALVGEQMRHGARLYVDIWDRKGPLLYALYAALAWLAPGVLAWQLAALLAVVAGALGIAAMGTALADARAGTLAGLAWCLLVLPLGGSNGQSEVFYEPLVIACAALLIADRGELRRGRLTWRLLGGFLCARLAIAMKQAAAIETGALGLIALAVQAHGRVAPARALANGVALALMAALPLLAVAATYAAAGHFAALWQALVTSNLARGYMPAAERWHRLPTVLALLALPLGFAALGAAALARRGDREALLIVLGWAIAAGGAILVFPNIVNHYLLTALPPLCVLATGVYRRGALGLAALAGLALTVMPASAALRWQDRAASRRESAALVAYARAVTPDRRLLVWGFPSYLYVLLDAPPPRPLAFPPHLFDAGENRAAGRDQASETRRILATRPQTVIVQQPLPVSPLNLESTALVSAYVARCRARRPFMLRDEFGPERQIVYSGCG